MFNNSIFVNNFNESIKILLKKIRSSIQTNEKNDDSID